VRIYSYIIKHLDEIISVTEDFGFEVIPVAWHHGEKRPCIGMFAKGAVVPDVDGIRLSIEFGDEVEAYVHRLGIRHLLELSGEETLRWQDVLHAPR
jgi:hypothetical protein